MEKLKYNQTRHGYSGTPVYRLWADIVKRTETQNDYYKDRGITMCEEWRNNPKSFCEWALLNGYKKGLEIDRINNDGNYEPTNCQFITHKENCARGKRRVYKSNSTGERNISLSKHNTFEVFVTIDGKQKYVGVRKTLNEAIILRDEIIGNIHDKD